MKLENISFIKKRSLDWSYNLENVQENQRSISVYSQYVFQNIPQAIPKTNIIIFEQELPQSYTKTEGNIGDKLVTEKQYDTELTVTDRIMKLEQGEEKITTKPVPLHEITQYKEYQIHERTDKIARKLTFKNETGQSMQNIEATFIETKEVRFLQSTPAPTKIDAPEYKWEIQIPADGSVSFELILESYTKQTYKITKEKIKPGPFQNEMMKAPNKMENRDFDNDSQTEEEEPSK